jgi:hypothetical protein
MIVETPVSIYSTSLYSSLFFIQINSREKRSRGGRDQTANEGGIEGEAEQARQRRQMLHTGEGEPEKLTKDESG